MISAKHAENHYYGKEGCHSGLQYTKTKFIAPGRREASHDVNYALTKAYGKPQSRRTQYKNCYHKHRIQSAGTFAGKT